MKFSIFEKERLVRSNEAEFGRFGSFLNWADEAENDETAKERDLVLDEIEKLGGTFDFLGSKTDARYLSRGCRICGEGAWSCLFINGMCNAKCFYCPSRQDEILDPKTNSFVFDSPDKYADYVNSFGFKGVSFSGGEPFLTFDLMLEYLKAVRKKCDSSIYIWAYTNGSLVNEEMLKKLKAEGLNELRFDIGAFDYSLKKAELATKIIDTVTVEIPMVPDHYELVKSLVNPMKDIGIKHLNLHQLRTNSYNLPKMIERDYKFLHGRKVTVFQSELSALKILLHSMKTDGVPVNYCSFVFKESFQSCATRKRYAGICAEPSEYITQNGYIRQVDESLEEEVRITYFAPITLSDEFNIEKKKMISYKLSRVDFNLIFDFINRSSNVEKRSSGRIIEMVPDFDINIKSLTAREFYEIFNFEILRGGFADYF